MNHPGKFIRRNKSWNRGSRAQAVEVRVHSEKRHQKIPVIQCNYRCNREGIAEKFSDPSVFETMLYEIHDINRFERVQNFASYARLVKCEKSSSGKRLGTGGAKIGNVHLKWAFSEAAVLFLRANPPAQRYIEKLRKKHGKSQVPFHSRPQAGPSRLLHDQTKEDFFHESFSHRMTGSSGEPDV